MKSLQRILSVASASAVLALVPGAALAHSFTPADSHNHYGSHGHVVRGTLSGGIAGLFSLQTLNSLSITTSPGQTVTITLTPKTHIDLEAQGTDAALFSGNAQIDVTAVVTQQNGSLVATQVDAHVNAGQKDSNDRGKADPKDNKGTTEAKDTQTHSHH